MKKLEIVLAVSGGCLAVVAVGTGYFLQSHWLWQAYWASFQSIIHRALMLACLLLLLAFALARELGTQVGRKPEEIYDNSFVNNLEKSGF